MAKLIILIFSILLLISEGYSQQLPFTYKVNSRTVENFGFPNGNSVQEIIIIGDTIWLNTSIGVSKSTDEGESWASYGKEIFGNEGVYSLTNKDGIVCATTGHLIKTKAGIYPEGSGLKFSTNQGNTWNSVPQSLDAKSDTILEYGTNRIYALPAEVAGANISYDIAINSKYIWTANWYGGLRRISIDELINNESSRWERIVLPPDNLTEIKPKDTLHFNLDPNKNRNHLVFSIVIVDDSTIYVGTAHGINISRDGGVSWKNVNSQNQTNPISVNWVTKMNYNYYDNSLWAATIKTSNDEYDAVSFSTDGGNSWEVVLKDEKARGFGFKNSEVLVTTENGVFRSNNMGSSWVLPNSIVDSETKLPLKATKFYSAASQGDYIWLGSENGLVRLNETNQMWLGEWKIFLASTPLTSIKDTYAFPNPFTPDAEYVKIKYSTNGLSQNVTVRIFDFGMNLIKTVIQNTERGNSIHSIDNSTIHGGVVDYWDGKDEFGRIVPNGVYFYRVDFENIDPVFGKIMVLM